MSNTSQSVTFSKVNGKWQGKVTVNGNFHVRLDKKESGAVEIAIATGSAVAPPPGLGFAAPCFIIDDEFNVGKIFPKDVIIKCLEPAKSDTPPTCTVTY